MATTDWFAQFLADMLQRPVERPESHETTVRGAAYLALAACTLVVRFNTFCSWLDMSNSTTVSPRRMDRPRPGAKSAKA